MNYPFDPHNTSSQNSRSTFSVISDQFILSESSMMSSTFMNNQSNSNNPNEVEKIFSYMKNVMSNPMLMDQMQKFLASKQAEKNSSFLKQNQSLSLSRMQSQLRQPPASYTNESHQLKPQPLRATPNPNVKKVKTPQMNQHIANRKKSDDGLMAYINSEEIPRRQPAENRKKNQKQKIYSDDRPIKPLQQQPIKVQQKQLPKPSQPVSFEDIPIKSTYIANGQFNNFDSAYGYPENASQFYDNNSVSIKKTTKNTVSTKANSNNNLQKVIDLEERPITGTKKDFKELLKEQFGETPFDQKPIPTLTNNSQNKWNEQDEYPNQNQNDDEQNQDQHKPKRQFLKRGSRQYLSSAKDKKPVQKKSIQNQLKDSQENLNSSRLGGERTERDKTPTKRDVSQNRVLSKRNTAANDKSVSKLKTQSNLNSSYHDQREDDVMKRSITPKNERPNQKSKNPILPPKSNKQTNNLGKSSIQNGHNPGSGKKKNVFDDSSSSEGETQQNESEQFQGQEQSVSNKQTKNYEREKKFSSYQPQKQFNMLSRQKKEQVIEGVYLTRSQLNTILERYAPSKNQPSTKAINSSEEKFNQLRKKYTDLCNLVEKQKIQHEEQMEKERAQFQSFKQQEIQKMKNEKRVMERQLKSSMPSQSQNLQKDKQEIENIKKQLEKEKEQHKKKEKNNKILIEKYKKQNEELKMRLQKLEEELEKQSQTSVQNNFSSTHSERQSSHAQNNARPSTSMNDKSKSKPLSKDLSPGKGKMNKSSKVFEENEQDQEQDKNYKKTVPLYKQAQDKKSGSGSNQNSKKASEKNSNFANEDQNSDEDNLPTFKMDNKKNDESAKGVKPQKKYQFIENSVQQTQHKKQVSNKNVSNHRKTSSKNVFVDESDEQNDQKVHSDEDSDDDRDRQSGFFKSQNKYQKLSDLMNSHFSIKEVTPQMIENLFRYKNNAQYRKYLQRVNNPKRMIVNSSKNGVDKKITNIYNDKSKEILFENGVKKEIFEDGYTIIYFKNGDIKQKLEDGTTLYYFNDKKVDQITLVNGLNIYRFDNNQVEIHYDGNKYIEIRNPDGTIKMLGSSIH